MPSLEKENEDFEEQFFENDRPVRVKRHKYGRGECGFLVKKVRPGETVRGGLF